MKITQKAAFLFAFVFLFLTSSAFGISTPSLDFATFLGGADEERITATSVDTNGDIYIAGWTESSDLPVTSGAFDLACGNGSCDGSQNQRDAFVGKLNSDGTGLSYLTYLGGTGRDEANGIAVDASGDVYVTGFTSSADFPTTAGALQTVNNSSSQTAFVVKLNASGTALVYATFLGGSSGEIGQGIAIDSSGNAYVAGQAGSTDFPVTTGAYDTAHNGGNDIFAVKINSTGTALVYGTFIGGSGSDGANSLALGSDGSVYITGQTFSGNFPVTMGAFQTSLSGTRDVFVTKLDSSGTTLDYSTYLGGAGSETGFCVAVDSQDQALVSGNTLSNDFPLQSATQATRGGGFDAFVTSLASDGQSLIFSSYHGGSSTDDARGCATDDDGNLYVSGFTQSSDYPTVDPLAGYETLNGGSDAFLAQIDPVASAVSFSSFFGGNSTDSCLAMSFENGNLYCAGESFSISQVATSGVVQGTNAGQADGIVFKAEIPPSVLEIEIDIKPGSSPNSINLGSNGNIPVAILSTATFDATTVDPLTVELASSPVALRGQGTPNTSEEDVNSDGLTDLIVHIETEALEIGDDTAVLSGQTFEGLQISGQDTVQVVP